MKKNKADIKKVVLAYSGGLDTSIIIPWLKENYNNCEVIAVSGDVGQGTELDGLEEKAIKTGASKLYVLDLKKDYVENYIWPCLKADAKYEDYLLGTSHAPTESIVAALQGTQYKGRTIQINISIKDRKDRNAKPAEAAETAQEPVASPEEPVQNTETADDGADHAQD